MARAVSAAASGVGAQDGHHQAVVAAPLPQQGVPQPSLDGEPALLVHSPRPRIVVEDLQAEPVQPDLVQGIVEERRVTSLP